MPASARARLLDLWDAHLAAPFPDELYCEPGGVDMVDVDACIAGCASSVLESGSFAEEGHAEALQRCVEDVRDVLPLVQSVDARVYCERLLALGCAARDVERGRAA